MFTEVGFLFLSLILDAGTSSTNITFIQLTLVLAFFFPLQMLILKFFQLGIVTIVDDRRENWR